VNYLSLQKYIFKPFEALNLLGFNIHQKVYLLKR
ncbi:hypothetical protein ACVW18_005067, partial [Bacillus thuringiensis]